MYKMSAVFATGVIASCLALASYEMINQYGGDLKITLKGKDDNTKVGTSIIPWIQNGACLPRICEHCGIPCLGDMNRLPCFHDVTLILATARIT